MRENNNKQQDEEFDKTPLVMANMQVFLRERETDNDALP